MTRIFSILMAAIFLSVGGILISVLFLSADQQASEQRNELLKKRSQDGDAKAQFSLGYAYKVGDGIEQDSAEAVKWYRLAAEQGDAFAQSALGSAYYFGEGVEQDYAEAVKWRRLAAEQGDASASYHLYVAYLRGEGVIQDLVYAHMWASMAEYMGLGVEMTDFIGEQMTPEQIAEAQKLARECVRKVYEDC